MKYNITIEASIIEAYKNGYEQRVKDQLIAAMEGKPTGSHFNEIDLARKAEKYLTNLKNS